MVDLLVDRTKHAPRDLLQLAIDEAPKTAPKLTEAQLAVLGASFLLQHVGSTANSWPGVVQWMNQYLKPVLEQATTTPSTLAHLEFSGCGTVQSLARARRLGGSEWRTYANCFQTDFPDEELAAQGLPEWAMQFIAPKDDDPKLKKVRFVSEAVIDSHAQDGDWTRSLLESSRICPAHIANSRPTFARPLSRKCRFYLGHSTSGRKTASASSHLRVLEWQLVMPLSRRPRRRNLPRCQFGSSDQRNGLTRSPIRVRK